MATATLPRHDIKDAKLAAAAARSASSGPTTTCRSWPASASASPRRSRSPACACRPACTSPPRPPTSPAPSRPAAPTSCLIASNPLSTQDDVAASLVQDFGIAVYAIHGEDTDTYYKHIVAALEHEPHVTMDDGADLVSAMIFVALDRLDDVHAQVRDVGRRS